MLRRYSIYVNRLGMSEDMQPAFLFLQLRRTNYWKMELRKWILLLCRDPIGYRLSSYF
jgi:hypothetical protein